MYLALLHDNRNFAISATVSKHFIQIGGVGQDIDITYGFTRLAIGLTGQGRERSGVFSED